MPNSKLVRITKTPPLPTINDYFTTMAERQGEEIHRLKQVALGEDSPAPKNRTSDRPAADAWIMHPTRLVKRKSTTVRVGAPRAKKSIPDAKR